MQQRMHQAGQRDIGIRKWGEWYHCKNLKQKGHNVPGNTNDDDDDIEDNINNNYSNNNMSCRPGVASLIVLILFSLRAGPVIILLPGFGVYMQSYRSF